MADERLRQLEEVKEQERLQQLAEEQERDEYRRRIKERNEQLELGRKREIERKRKVTEMKVKMTLDEQARDNRIRKACKDGVRQDRKRTLERMMGHQEHERQLLREKISAETEKAMSIKLDKEQLLD